MAFLKTQCISEVAHKPDDNSLALSYQRIILLSYEKISHFVIVIIYISVAKQFPNYFSNFTSSQRGLNLFIITSLECLTKCEIRRQTTQASPIVSKLATANMHLENKENKEMWLRQI